MAQCCASLPIFRSTRWFAHQLKRPVRRCGAASLANASRPGRCSGISEDKMPPAIPIATYRLQLTAGFGFEAAAAILPHLKAPRITPLYAAPLLKAPRGPTHGHYILDQTKFH